LPFFQSAGISTEKRALEKVTFSAEAGRVANRRRRTKRERIPRL